MATEPAVVTIPATEPIDESNATISPPATDAKTRDPVPGDELPSAETRRKAEELPVLDREGKSHAFKSLYEGPESGSRVLVIFIRHFFCGVRPPMKGAQRVVYVFYETNHPPLSRAARSFYVLYATLFNRMICSDFQSVPRLPLWAAATPV